MIFYGNCQVRVLARMFGLDPTVGEDWDIGYVASYEDAASPIAPVANAVIESAVIFFEQLDPAPFCQRAFLPANCRTIRFPALDFNLLWPLHCLNPYTLGNSEVCPGVRFPYGDRVIVDCVKRGMSAEEIITYYERHSHEYLPNLGRLARLERARLADREEKCAFEMSDLILASYASEKLFWSNNHPTLLLLAELGKRLIESVKDVSITLKAIDLEATICDFPSPSDMDWCKVPVHPAVADQLALSWYPDAKSLSYRTSSGPTDYDGYFREMVLDSVSARDAP